MKRRKLHLALTIIYVVAMIITFAFSLLQLIDFAQNLPQRDILETLAIIELGAAIIIVLVHTGIVFVCEYGIYSSLCYWLFQEKSSTVRSAWEIVKLAISILIIIERGIAAFN